MLFQAIDTHEASCEALARLMRPVQSFLNLQLPALDILDKFFEKHKPSREFSIDEAMAAFKGRHYMKQYIKSKPTKWGFKIWVLASPQGYVLHGNVNMEKK
ncbi:hypothetical protein J437_LFUL016200 [Ladona fulva]|uniref:PiggyBac transposable element-derived protein domain-containing protein n=1 Tax=Ladona fulva TaxID=123851 RepID=A0A8K0KLI9_LADFU|nr:hypothetical protein J437_LFUL016200 [Ladona fulva]